MSRYTHKPDISVKLSPRITRKTKRLIDQICRRHEMFEANVLRFCLEAIVPLAAKHGMTWLTRQIPGFDRRRVLSLSTMFTVRTSRLVKDKIDKLSGYGRGEFTEAEILRYCYDVILPIAYRDGFAKIMAMREKNLG